MYNHYTLLFFAQPRSILDLKLAENAKVSAFHCLYLPLQMAGAETRGKKGGKIA